MPNTASNAVPRAVPTTAAALVERVRARLEQRVPEVAHDAYPDKPDTYRLTHQVGAFLVGYRGAEYAGALGAEEQTFERRPLLDVSLLARSLNGADGALVLFERGVRALAGYPVPAFGRLVPRREHFLGYEDGVWTYVATFAARTRLVAEPPDDADAPILRTITADSPFGRAVAPSGARKLCPFTPRPAAC